jgi:hypothetical protein
MNRELTTPASHGDLLHAVKVQVRQRQYQALRAANKELIAHYWWLGEAISRRQGEQCRAKALVETLARRNDLLKRELQGFIHPMNQEI